MKRKKIDQVILSILINNLFWIAEEMNVYLAKAAFSTNIKVRRDCSCGLYTRNGEMVAQGEFVPVHLGVMSQTLRAVLEHHPVETLREGDILIHNDPFVMGSHLWDVMIFKPIFFHKQLVAFAGTIAHHVDIGGSPVANGTTVFEEGLRLPPVKLYKAGVLQEDILRIITHNVRTPYEVKGDVAAQTAACYRGEQRIKELIEKFGIEDFIAYLDSILDYSEKGMRDAIAQLPDGEASFEDFLEYNGIEPHLTRIRATLVVKGDEIFVSFDGSGEPGAGGVNSVWSITHSAVYYAVKSVLGSNIPTNQGAYRPIHLNRPDFDTIVDAKYPHAVANCTSTASQRIADVVIGALAKIVPQKACACDGHWACSRFVGVDPRNGRYSSYVETYACGRGAKHDQDGADAHQTHMTNTANAPIEIIELEHPLTVERYALVPDSGGAGEYRGGVGLIRQLRPCAEMSVTLDEMRPTIQPYGLFGGRGGACDYLRIEKADGTKLLKSTKVMPGDVCVIQTSGGGGWGDPLKRDFAAIESDVANGYVTIRGARDGYRVVIDPQTGRVDIGATEMLRAQHAS
jgi:N-methylhydantoinase B